VTRTLSIVGALLLVAANGFFVATEFAIARIRVTQVDELEREGRPGAASLRHALDNLDAYLAACQLGITIASIGLGIVGKPAFEKLIEPVTGPLGGAAHAVSFAFAFAIVTLLHVVLGELAPKSLAIARNTRTALAIALPMRVFYLSAKPFVDFFNWLGNLVLKPFGVPPAREVGHAPHTEAELRLLLAQSVKEGLLEPEELAFTEKVFSFGDRSVADVMVSRPELVAISADLPTDEVLAAVVDSPYTRYPVYRETLDDIVGILHVRDLFSAFHGAGAGEVRIADVLRPAYLVPETKKLDDLLTDLRRTSQHMAVVVDEYGATQGIVTLEDVLEEIVGEIEDEYDLPDQSVVRLPDGRLRVYGTVPIAEFNERFGCELPLEDYHTLAGFVFGQLGRAPKRGDEIVRSGVRFTVVEVEGPRIDALEVELPSAAAPVAPRQG
jgi:CBS domain containing-hemolysin-like protein